MASASPPSEALDNLNLDEPAKTEQDTEKDWESEPSEDEFSDDESSNDGDTEEAVLKCATCNKEATNTTTAPEGSPPVTLKCCARCLTRWCCSTDCQRADWKTHKKTCKKPNGLLHNIPEKEAFQKLIDSYRLRVEDEYTFQGSLSGVYDGRDPMRGFRRFLNKAEKKVGILPVLWNKDKRVEYEALAKNKGQHFCVYFAQEKSDIQEQWKNPMMPMLLRMMSHEIYGSNVVPW